MMRLTLLTMWFAFMATPGVLAQDAPKGLDPYLEGLDALDSAKWPEAAAAFGRAIDQSQDNADYYVARGVAYALGEKLKEAEADLQRAQRLGTRSNEVRLWLATVVAMQGDFQRDSTIFSAATHDPYENAVRRMSRDYGGANFGKFRRELVRQSGGNVEDDAHADNDPSEKAKQQQARALFPELGVAFAQRMKSSPGLVPMLLARAVQLYQAQQYAAALRNLQPVVAAQPNDPSMLFYVAGCHLHLGVPAAARAEFTRVIAAQPTNAEAFFGRAMAAAAMGDPNRVRIDLDLAAKFKPADAGRYRKEPAIVAIMAKPISKPEAVPAMVKDLQSKAAGGAKWEDLIAGATEIVKAVNGYRLHADEAYEDRLRTLEEPTKRIPCSAESLATLGEFLYEQAVMVRGESVEPRAQFRSYRRQTKESQEDELARAEQSLDAALGIDPNNVQALTFKAACRMWRLQWEDGEVLLKKAMAIRSDYPPLLDVFSQLLDHAGAVRAAKASRMRQVRSWSDLTYHYWYYPSQAELDQADDYDRQAKQLWELAMKYLEAAAASHRGTADGFYYEGIVARRKGDADAARKAFEQAVKLSPANVSARDQLSAIYAAIGMSREAFEAQAIATNYSHTTAGPLLRFAWMEIVRTAFDSSRNALGLGMRFDPADPRVAAYRAVLGEAENQPADAMAWYQVAAALAEARARLRGISARSGSEPLNPIDVGLAMQINLRTGRLLAKLGRPADAIEVLRLNAALQPRIARDDLFTKLDTSMLPNPAGDATSIPEADSFMSLVAWSRLETGNALTALKRPDEALVEFATVIDIPKMVPPTVDPGNVFKDPVAWATFGACRSLVAKGQIEPAWQLMQSRPWGLSPEADAEWRKLEQQTTAARVQQANNEAAQQNEQYRRQQQEQKERILRERQQRDEERRRQRDPIRRNQ